MTVLFLVFSKMILEHTSMLVEHSTIWKCLKKPKMHISR